MDAVRGCGEGLAAVTPGDLKSEISLALVKDMRIDDVVLFHLGYAHTMTREEEATRTLRLFTEAGLTAGEPA